MNQLLMRWDTSAIEDTKISGEYKRHTFRRWGDELFGKDEFRYLWVDSRDEAHSERFEALFDNIYSDELVPDDGFFCILDSDNKIVATSHIQIGEHTPDSATVHSVAVSENHRGQQLGKAVTVMVMKYAFDKGFKELYLTTDDFRLPAVNLYIKLGFMPVLYEADMRDRWTRLIKDNGYDKVRIIDEQGNYSFI